MSTELTSSRFSSDFFVNALLFLFPIGINTLKGSGDLVLLLLAIVGIVHCFKNGLSNINTKAFKLFCAATLGYFLVLVISVVFSGKPSELARYLARDLHFLFAPLIFIACANVKINVRFVFLGIKIALILMGAIVSYQSFGGVGRPSGVMNAATFGNLAVMTLFLLIAYSLVEIKKFNFLSLLAIVFGVAAVLLSGTRGALLSALLMSIICAFFVIRYLNINRKVIGIMFFGALSAVLLVGVFSDSMQHRVVTGYKNASLWFEGKNKTSSVGLRLEMYKASMLALKDMPLLTGYGYRNANPIVAKYADPSAQRTIAGFNHLHNAYISNLLFNGVLGLMALLLVLFFPIKTFYFGLSSKEHQVWAFSGILLCLGYASFGVVNILLGDVFMNAYYVFFVTLLYAQVNKN